MPDYPLNQPRGPFERSPSSLADTVAPSGEGTCLAAVRRDGSYRKRFNDRVGRGVRRDYRNQETD